MGNITRKLNENKGGEMHKLKIKIPDGYVQTCEAIKILGIKYKHKTRIHQIRDSLVYIVLNNRRRKNQTRGRYFWELESLEKYKRKGIKRYKKRRKKYAEYRRR